MPAAQKMKRWNLLRGSGFTEFIINPSLKVFNIQVIQQLPQPQGQEGGLAPALLVLLSYSHGPQMVQPDLPGALHFVRGHFLERLPIFEEECCQSFIDILSDLLEEWPCKLIAYVLMPDHLHLIVNPRDGRIIEFTGKLKSLAGRGITKTAIGIEFKQDSDGSHLVWQDSFKAIPLWSSWMIWQKINYIHANPVKAKLVSSAKDYRSSSFKAFYSGDEEPLRVDREWWWPDDSEKLSKAMKELGWRSYDKRD